MSKATPKTTTKAKSTSKTSTKSVSGGKTAARAKTLATPRLGRGLSSLISQSVRTPSTEGVYQPQQTSAAASDDTAVSRPADPASVSIDQIAPNPYQPRRAFNEAELVELSASIAQQGIIQPLIVAKAPGENADKPYVLIAGERRLRAARMASLQQVPCVIRQADSRQMLEWALVENIQREDLNPIERAQAYQQYIDRFSLTQLEAGQRLGQPRATVANHLRLLGLQQGVQQLVASGSLSFGHAKVLASMTDAPQRQTDLAQRVVADGLSVRHLERLVEASVAELSSTAAPEKPKPRKAAHIVDVEDRLTQTVGTRVLINPGRAKHTGKIQIEYYSLDDFDRISSLLGLPADS